MDVVRKMLGEGKKEKEDKDSVVNQIKKNQLGLNVNKGEKDD